MISNFRRVPNVMCFLLGNSPGSESRRRGITQKKACTLKLKMRSFAVVSNFDDLTSITTTYAW